MTDKRPVLVGINNPINSDPKYALYPYPEGCTGHRLFMMLVSRRPEVSRSDYIRAFDRRNVVPLPAYTMGMAREGAARLEQEFFGTGRTVVLLGEDVRKAFSHPRLLVHPQVIGGVTYRQIPHPSGRNLWYNVEDNRMAVALLLEELYNGV